MDLKEDKWINSLKDKLDGYEVEPPLNGWDLIRKDLDAKASTAPHVSMSRRVFFFAVPLAAAVALLILFVPLGGHKDEPQVDRADLSNPVSPESGTLPHVTPQTTFPSIPSPSSAELIASNMGNSKASEASTRVSNNLDSFLITRERSSEAFSQTLHPQDMGDDTMASSKEYATINSLDKSGAEPEPHLKKKTNVGPEPERTREPIMAEHSSMGKTTASGAWNVSLAVASAGSGSTGNISLGSSYDYFAYTRSNPPAVEVMSDRMPAISAYSLSRVPYESEEIERIDHKLPVQVGISVRKELGANIGIETGIIYTLLNSDVKIREKASNVKQTLHYIGVPVNVSWTFYKNHRFRTDVTGGIMIEKCVSAKFGDDTFKLTNFQPSLHVGLGGEYRLSRYMGIYIQPTASYYFKDDTPIRTIRTENPLQLGIKGGIRFTF